MAALLSDDVSQQLLRDATAAPTATVQKSCSRDRHIRAVIDGAAIEVGRFADAVIGTGPLPGTAEWEAEQTTKTPGERAIA